MIMTPEMATCIRIRMGGLISCFPPVLPPRSTVKTLQTEGDIFVGGEVHSGWNFVIFSAWWCQRDRLTHAEIWQPLSALANWSVVLLLTPPSSLFADSCSKWENWWLIIAVCRRIGLLRKRKLTCGGKTGFCGPSESFYDFPATSSCKTWVCQ